MRFQQERLTQARVKLAVQNENMSQEQILAQIQQVQPKVGLTTQAFLGISNISQFSMPGALKTYHADTLYQQLIAAQNRQLILEERSKVIKKMLVIEKLRQDENVIEKLKEKIEDYQERLMEIADQKKYLQLSLRRETDRTERVLNRGGNILNKLSSIPNHQVETPQGVNKRLETNICSHTEYQFRRIFQHSPILRLRRDPRETLHTVYSHHTHMPFELREYATDQWCEIQNLPSYPQKFVGKSAKHYREFLLTYPEFFQVATFVGQARFTKFIKILTDVEPCLVIPELTFTRKIAQPQDVQTFNSQIPLAKITALRRIARIPTSVLLDVYTIRQKSGFPVNDVEKYLPEIIQRVRYEPLLTKPSSSIIFSVLTRESTLQEILLPSYLPQQSPRVDTTPKIPLIDIPATQEAALNPRSLDREEPTLSIRAKLILSRRVFGLCYYFIGPGFSWFYESENTSKSASKGYPISWKIPDYSKQQQIDAMREAYYSTIKKNRDLAKLDVAKYYETLKNMTKPK